MLKPLIRHQLKPTRIILDVMELGASDQTEWLTFIEFASRTLGVEVSMGSFSGMPPDEQVDFAYVTESGALSRKLLLNVPLLYIQPCSGPANVDAYFYWKMIELYGQANSWRPVTHSVALISSIYRGDEFLFGFLDNCKTLWDYENCEHFLIRAGSSGNEHVQLVEHVRRCPSAVYLNLAEDPGLYEVWNLGSRLSTSRYISNANIDDRRAPDHITHLKEVLDTNLDVSVASTALRISKKRNLDWKESDGCEVWFGNVGNLRVGTEGLFEQKDGELVSRNFPHCMPVWRRSLHAQVGEFDEKKYGPSADWAIWVHAGFKGVRFHLSAKPLGLYLYDEKSYWRRASSNRQNDRRIVEEYTAWDNLAKEPGRLHHSISREISDMVSLFRTGSIYEGLGRLLDVAQQSHRLGVMEHTLLSRVAMQFLGCEDFSSLLSPFRNILELGQLFDNALVNVWANLVHSFGSKSSRVRLTLELACVDLSECIGDFRGLLLRAMLAHRQGDLVFEQILLQHLLDEDRDMLWNTLAGLSWK